MKNNVRPNFSVIMPVKCNANCRFCDWKERVGLNEDMLRETIQSLPDKFTQCSITGGEPTLHKNLQRYIDILRARFSKVILNTNGSYLSEYIAKSVNYVNISRHHYEDDKNNNIFGSTEVANASTIGKVASKANVTLNCWLPEGFSDTNFIAKYILHAKGLGCKVAFRKDHGNLDLLPVDNSEVSLINEYGDQACTNREHLINDTLVTFKYILREPSVETNTIYEAVLQGNGDLTSDWLGNNPILEGEI